MLQASAPTTTMTVYAFGLEEHTYTGGESSTGNTYYYSFTGRLIGQWDGNAATQYDLTDAQGSVLAAFSATTGTTSVLGNQLYDPYGNSRAKTGTLNTSKGYTGQYNDSATGLDYYNARYYDSAVGTFLSADTVLGNRQGMNPYGYVRGNPERWTDPTGHIIPDGQGGEGGGPSETVYQADGSTGGGDGSGGGNYVPVTSDFNPADPSFSATEASQNSNLQSEINQERQAEARAEAQERIQQQEQIQNQTKAPEPQEQPNPPQMGTGEAQSGKGGNDDGGLGNLKGLKLNVSDPGLTKVVNHLSNPNFLDEGGNIAPENQAMINRLQDAMTNGSKIFGADASFYMHELYESTLMEDGLSYSEAHEAAIGKYGVSPFSIYHPDVIQEFPKLFNSRWFLFWRIER